MDKESLVKRKQEVEDRFNTLSSQRAETDAEQLRLQGEYRILKDLLEQFEQEGKEQ
jgi:hypothetical protein